MNTSHPTETTGAGSEKGSLRGKRGLLWWLPASFASFIYTVLLKPRFLRSLAHRVICRIIPPTVEIQGVKLALNQEDAIVSGNLALGCYEVTNLELFASKLKPGMTVLDVGANIGLYTAVASRIVGPTGRVISIEPDRTNCSFIHRTIELNGSKNVTVVQKAAGNECRESFLYLCDTNKADHRTHDPSQQRKRVPVSITTLDALLGDLGVEQVDLMKIDTQGSEAQVFAGMQHTLARNPQVEIFMEFWPWGIHQAGGSPRALLDAIIAGQFHVHEIGERGEVARLAEFDSILALTLERQHTDLLLRRG
jgi:FkbM family methyltransferase